MQAIGRSSTPRIREELLAAARQMAEALPTIVFTASAHGEITYVNQRWTALTGLSSDTSSVAAWAGNLHPQDCSTICEQWRHALETGEAFHGECRIKTSEGIYRWFSVHAIPYREDGKTILRWYAVLMEIHEAHALSAEHEITLELQRALLPGMVPVLPGGTLSVFYSPSDSTTKIGEDWYDAFVIKGDIIAFSVGDVAGHGPHAAMVMGEMRQAIRGAILEGARIEDALARENRFLFTHHPDIHVTAVAASYDVSAHCLCVANAGHPPPLIRRPNSLVEVLEQDGPPLGVLDTFVAPVMEAILEPGCGIVFYTDGLIETHTDIIAGLENLIAVVGEMQTFDTRSAYAIADRITLQREHQDDIAILTVKV